MINDGYAEHIVKTKSNPVHTFLFVMGIIFAAIGIIFSLFATLGLIVFVIGGLVAIISKPKMDCEFEYTMVNEDVEIARIFSKSTRKSAYQFGGGDVKLVAKLDSIYLDNERQASKGAMTVRDFTSKNPENVDKVYAFVVNTKKGTDEVLLELNEKTLEHVKMFYKGKIKE